MRGLDEELTTHKYSHVERERRFLVDAERCPDLSRTSAIRIEDRYLIGTRFRLRRMIDLDSGRVVVKLSKKYDADDVRARPMVTAYLTEAEHATFAALPALRIDKVRHDVAVGTQPFGIDVFEGALAGLVLAEIECADPDALDDVVMPHWATSEVTDEPAFQGGNLASLSGEQLRAFL